MKKTEAKKTETKKTTKAVEAVKEDVKVVAAVSDNKEVEEKVAEDKATATKAAATKTTATKTAATKATATKTTATKAVKKASEKVVLQINGRSDLVMEELVERVKAAYVEEGNKAASIKNVEIYIKLDENMAYYVIDGYASGISLY